MFQSGQNHRRAIRIDDFLYVSDNQGNIDRISKTISGADIVRRGEFVYVMRSHSEIIDSVELTEATFRMEPPASVAVAMRELGDAVEQVTWQPLQAACYSVIGHDGFEEAPAASTHHEIFPGGLAVHTNKVVKIVKALADANIGIDKDIALTAAFWHDVGKITCYDTDEFGFARSNSTDREQGHIFQSAADFKSWCDQQDDMDRDMEDAILHCIISSHGRQDWGSWIEPRNVTAWAVHFADMLSIK